MSEAEKAAKKKEIEEAEKAVKAFKFIRSEPPKKKRYGKG